MEGRKPRGFFIDILYSKYITLKWLFKANFTAIQTLLLLAV